MQDDTAAKEIFESLRQAGERMVRQGLSGPDDLRTAAEILDLEPLLSADQQEEVGLCRAIAQLVRRQIARACRAGNALLLGIVETLARCSWAIEDLYSEAQAMCSTLTVRDGALSRTA